MTSEHLDWDNLTAAARRLGQDHKTVGRRIASLESGLACRMSAIGD
jgi:DNA-binding transcriptional LysR family regulator